MSNNLKTKLNGITKELFEKLDLLEQQLTHVKKGLSDFLKEDDVVSLPSYNLLKSIYSEFLTSVPERPHTKHHKIDDLYDPMYAPPGTRKKTGARLKKPPGQISINPLCNSRPAKSPIEGLLPDFGSSLLEDMNKPKSMRKQSDTITNAQCQGLPKVITVNVSKGHTVYQVEIHGKVYLRYGKYFYDLQSKYRVGSIENTCFALDTKSPINIVDTITLTHVPGNDEYYESDGKLFVQVGDNIPVFQGVGELTEDNEIGLWE